MKLDSKLPEKLERILDSLLEGDERVLYSQCSDLTLDRKFGTSFVVVTTTKLVAFGSQETTAVFKLADTKELKVEELFGSARLVAITDRGTEHLVYYSKAFVPEFGVLCRVVNQLIRGTAPELPEEDEMAYCPRCGAPLPERGSNCPLCVPRWIVFQRLLGFVAPFKVRAWLLVAGTVVTVASQMVPPYITKRIVDDVIRAGRLEELKGWILLMLGCGVVFLVARFFSGVMSAWLAARLVADLRARLHTALQRLQLSYFSHRGSGELVGRIMHDTAELQHFLVDGLPYLMVNSVSFVVIAVILVRLDVRLALLVFLPVPFLIFGANWFWQKLDPLFHQRGSKVSALHSFLNESINGIRVIKAFAQGKRRSGQFNATNEKLFHLRFRIESTFVGYQEVMFWIMQIGVTGVWFFAARRIALHDPTLTLGDLLAFVGYIWLLYGPMQWFTAVLDWMTHAFTGAERIFSVLDKPAEIYEPPDAVSIPKIRGRICFDDVRFSYERGKEVIKGMSFDVEPGEVIGLVGRSGAGKSTIINLICRFFDVDSGAISIDGHNIKRIELEQMRQQLGIVMQESFLFNTSIIENICYGNPKASFEEVVQAARTAHAHDFILDKEDGYDAIIGERGMQLSGGEKQRLSIARAILHNPPILILDEATSSVDSETEKYIQEAIANLIKGRTTIAIAHRLSTLRNADRLFFIEDGKILEMGTHDELLAKDGHYAKLVKTQTELNKIKGTVWQE